MEKYKKHAEEDVKRVNTKTCTKGHTQLSSFLPMDPTC